jgi:hypothetical protein
VDGFERAAHPLASLSATRNLEASGPGTSHPTITPPCAQLPLLRGGEGSVVCESRARGRSNYPWCEQTPHRWEQTPVKHLRASHGAMEVGWAAPVSECIQTYAGHETVVVLPRDNPSTAQCSAVGQVRVQARCTTSRPLRTGPQLRPDPDPVEGLPLQAFDAAKPSAVRTKQRI